MKKPVTTCAWSASRRRKPARIQPKTEFSRSMMPMAVRSNPEALDMNGSPVS